MTTSTSQEIIVRVLLIEESKADARLILESLARTDKGRFHLTWVENLSSGLKYLSSTKMNVVLLDLDLADGHGLETLSSLSQGIPQMPVIVLVSLANERSVETALRKGACDYLIKEEL